jgi:hypothetical protein
MAQDINTNININTNTDDVNKDFKSLRTQLREAQLEVATLSEKFGATSKEAVGAAKRASELKDTIGDAKGLTDAFNPDAKFKALSSSLAGVAGGFAAVQGGMALFGTESEKVEQTLLKVQSAMALSQGLQAIGESMDSFKQLKAVAIDAFNGIKTAIGSSGIGLLLIALGSVYTYWDDIKEAVGGVSEEQKNLNKLAEDNLKTEQQKLSTIGDQDNILKLQGKSEKEILESKIRQTDEVIKATELSIQNAEITLRSQIEAEIRNKKILTGLLEVVQFVPLQILNLVDLLGEAIGKNLNLASRFKDFATGFIFDPEQTRKEGEAAIQAQRDSLNKLRNERAGFQLAIKDIDTKNKEERERLAKEKSDRSLESRREYLQKAKDQQEEFSKLDDERRKREADAEELKKNETLNRLKAEAGGLNTLNAYKQKTSEEDQIREQAVADAKVSIAQNTISLISEIAGKGSKVGKALALAQATISGIEGVQNAYTTAQKSPVTIAFPAYPLVQAGLAGAFSLLQLKRIASTDPTGKSTPNLGAGGGVGGGAPQAQFNIVGASSTNQLASTIGSQQNKPVAAYVVGSDVTTQQSLDRNRINNSTFI